MQNRCITPAVLGLLMAVLVLTGCSRQADSDTADAFTAPTETAGADVTAKADSAPPNVVAESTPVSTARHADGRARYAVNVPAEHALDATFQRHVSLQSRTIVTLPNGQTDVTVDHDFDFVGDVTVTAVKNGHQATERIVVRRCLLKRRGSMPGPSGVLMEPGTVLEFSREGGKLTMLQDGQARDPYALYDGILEMVCGATDPRNPVDAAWLTPDTQMAVGDSWTLDTAQLELILRDSMHGLTAKSTGGTVKLADMDLPPSPELPTQILMAQMTLDGLTGTVANDEQPGMTITVTGGKLVMDMQWIYPYPEAIILPQVMEMQTVVDMNGRVEAQGRRLNVKVTTTMDASISEIALD